MDGWGQFEENGVLWFTLTGSSSTNFPPSVFVVPISEITYLGEFEYRDEQAQRDITELERIFKLTDDRES